MINKAVAKITEECEGKDFLIPFEEYLTNICTTEKIAEKILNPSKKLEKCFETMKEKARKRAVNGIGFIPPEEGYEIIRNYYGIDLNEEKTNGTVIDITDLL